jgi:hypothetical protein
MKSLPTYRLANAMNATLIAMSRQTTVTGGSRNIDLQPLARRQAARIVISNLSVWIVTRAAE